MQQQLSSEFQNLLSAPAEIPSSLDKTAPPLPLRLLDVLGGCGPAASTIIGTFLAGDRKAIAALCCTSRTLKQLVDSCITYFRFRDERQGADVASLALKFPSCQRSSH